MNRIMLLAQLCGEGPATEALLRKHGYHDLESVAGADALIFSEQMKMSPAAARRIVSQARELLASGHKRSGAGLDGGGRNPLIGARIDPERKRRRRTSSTGADKPPRGEKRRADAEVTADETRYLRSVVRQEDGERTPHSGQPEVTPTGAEDAGFWRFG